MLTIAVGVAATGTLGEYWRYRRRYYPIAETGGRLLRYAGERRLTFGEKCWLAAAIGGGAVIMPFAILLWLAWFV